MHTYDRVANVHFNMYFLAYDYTSDQINKRNTVLTHSHDFLLTEKWFNTCLAGRPGYFRSWVLIGAGREGVNVAEWQLITITHCTRIT